MTPAQELHAIRRALGATQIMMAKILGLSGKSGELRVDDFETGKRPISGPVLRLMDYLAQGIDIGGQDLSQALLRAQPEFENYVGYDENGNGFEGVRHSKFPRFIAFFADELPLSMQSSLKESDSGLISLWMPEESGLGELIAVPLDPIVGPVEPLLREAARFMAPK